MVPALAPVELIERSRRGDPVEPESIRRFVEAWLDDEAGVGDAQMAAWCMAVCLRGLDEAGTAALTAALIASGDRLRLDRLGPTGDKHSTGGVGDATSLVVAPLAAALGVRVAKMSGRGLGHTGGTIDKLEAIPGMKVDLDLEAFVRQVRDVGVAVTGQTDRLVPADRRLYALRDQTATVESPALIAASVMSKKIAGGAGAIVLDVKAGSGAFFADAAAAREAAEAMVRVAAPWERRVRYLVTAMDQPLGRWVGNALEVRGAGEVLTGAGAPDLRALALLLVGLLAEAAGVVGAGEGKRAARAALDEGRALQAAERWVQAQGGDPSVWTSPAALPLAPLTLAVPAPAGGVVATLEARRIGEAARYLGAGRLHPTQAIDHAVGIELHAKVGDPIGAGEPVATVHARDRWVGDRAVAMVAEAIRVADAPPPAELLVPAEPLVLAEGGSDA